VVGDREQDGDLAAGVFSTWLGEIGGALRGEGAADVPCDGCTACCTAFQFVLIEPDETDTLAHIPAPLLFPAPRMPPGHVVLGYDDRGHCPMLVDNRCSIYEHRPRTCQTYDCRVFPAADVDPAEDGSTKELIADRTRRWRFTYPADADRTRHEAVRAAAKFLRDSDVVANATQRAVLAVEIHELFWGDAQPDPEVLSVEIERRVTTPWPPRRRL